jgi:hypothetical protein
MGSKPGAVPLAPLDPDQVEQLELSASTVPVGIAIQKQVGISQEQRQCLLEVTLRLIRKFRRDTGLQPHIVATAHTSLYAINREFGSTVHLVRQALVDQMRFRLAAIEPPASIEDILDHVEAWGHEWEFATPTPELQLGVSGALVDCLLRHGITSTAGLPTASTAAVIAALLVGPYRPDQARALLDRLLMMNS